MIYKKITKINNNINNIIDEYLDIITIKELRNYLKNKTNYNNFTINYNISETLEDIMLILDDREIYKKKNNITENMNIKFEYEKILSDYYNVSIGHVENIKNNKFTINDLGDIKDVYIFNKSDFKRYKDAIISKIIFDINDSNLITDFKVFKQIDALKIDLNKFIKRDELKDYLENELDMKKCIEWVGKILDSVFIEEYKECYIFEIK